MRRHLLQSSPNLRKAAPRGMKLLFPHYLGNLVVNIDTTYKVERIMWTGEYEPPLIRFLETHHTDGWVCFDVGANVGALALALAKFTGSEGKVYAFEPGELWWAEEDGNPGNALLSAEGTHRIKVITLDDFAAEEGIGRADFIKIDVEGMELEVMRGAVGLLRRFHPVLYFETLSRYVKSARGAAFSDFQKLLVDEFGYRLYRLSRSGELFPLTDREYGGYTVAVHPANPALPSA
jgi:hypothetical protein